ncbi:MAG: sensor histidine kinase [Longimicrobiales bacterium]
MDVALTDGEPATRDEMAVRMRRKRTLERKLFGWLVVLALVPALLVLAAALAAGSSSVAWFGTLGAWTEVGASGQTLVTAIEQQAPDSVVAGAAERHRAQLSESLRLANRWTYIGERITSLAPVFVGLLALVLAVVAAWTAKRLARDLARPIAELTEWAPSMARGEALPAAGATESADVKEVRALRSAMRDAAIEIAAGRTRAVEAERTRVWGEMARRVAHEMKNPLTPLRLAARRLTQATAGNGAMAEVVAVIEQETDRLDDLARSFALLGRPPDGPATEIDPVEMMTVLLASDVPHGIARSLHAESGVTTILGHYDALLRAFRNLVRNAVEAVAPVDRPGVIEVQVRSLPEGGVEIVVADNGIGIPPHARDVIFEPDRTWKAGGTGLGLAVVQQVVASHDGTVRVRDRSEHGSEFVVVLPAGIRQPTAEGTLQETGGTS